MSTVPADLEGPSDAELIGSVRSGAVSAYGSLYERHVGAARNLARQLTRNPAEADDLVSEAFAKVLHTLKDGRGPDSSFRAYLLTALRHTAYDKTRRDRKVELSDDVSEVSGVNPEAVSVPFTDTAVAGLERSLAARAFATLPERWQAVLWHTEIEGQSPAEVAPILGLTPNGVSALAYRAREGLKQAYLQVHLAETTAERCRSASDRLGAWARGGLSKRETAQVETHLDDCERCRALAAELSDINTGLRAVVAPLVLGIGAAAGYLAAAKASAVAVAATGVVGAGTAAAAAGSGGAGAAAGAAASAPRQFLGVAASGVALAAAVVVGLTSGPSDPQAPVAAPPPPTSTSTAKPAPQAPPPAKPAPTTKPTTPKPTTTTTTPPTTPPPPAAVPPSLDASGPGTTVSLVPGGGPADLPITVRNTGGSLSPPVRATLVLPKGIEAVATDRLAGEPMLRLNGAVPSTVRCPGGSGSVTCGTSAGLAPGDSVTLLFRLVALPGATGGQISGTVSAGAKLAIQVSVPVAVTPVAEDKVKVLASVDSDNWFASLWPWQRDVLLRVWVTNIGASTKPVSLSVDERGNQVSVSRSAACTTGSSSVDCSVASVPPATTVEFVFRLSRGHDHPDDGKNRKVTVVAVLGTASAQASVTVPWTHGPWLPELVPTMPVMPVPAPPTNDPAEPTKIRPQIPSSAKPTTAKPPKPVTTPTVPPIKPPNIPVISVTPPRPEPGQLPTPICEPDKKLWWWFWTCPR